MVLGIGDHHVPGLSEGSLDLRGDGGVHRGEKQARGIAWFAFFHYQAWNGIWHGAAQPPGGSFPVPLPRRAIARPQPLEIEPRVVLQEFHEMLAYHAGGSKDANFNSGLHKLLRFGEQLPHHFLINADRVVQFRLGIRSSSVCATWIEPGPIRKGIPHAPPNAGMSVVYATTVVSIPASEPSRSAGISILSRASAFPATAAAMASFVAVESPTRRIMISATASSAITLGARPPAMVPMFNVLRPSSSSTGNGIARMRASASSSLSMADSPSSGYAE